ARALAPAPDADPEEAGHEDAGEAPPDRAGAVVRAAHQDEQQHEQAGADEARGDVAADRRLQAEAAVVLRQERPGDAVEEEADAADDRQRDEDAADEQRVDVP